MEVHFTPEQEAHSFQAARATGEAAEDLVRVAALRFAEDARFRAAVMEGKAFADRGEFTLWWFRLHRYRGRRVIGVALEPRGKERHCSPEH